MNNLWLTLTNIRWQDVLDILLVAFLIYQLFLFIKGTRAVQIIIGLVVIFIAFLAGPPARIADLELDIEQLLEFHHLGHHYPLQIGNPSGVGPGGAEPFCQDHGRDPADD